MLKEALKKHYFLEDAMTLAAFHQNAKRILFPKASSHSFLSLIFSGPNLKDQWVTDLTHNRSVDFLQHKKRPPHSTVKTRHTLAREPPIPIYIALNIHQLSRSKKLIEQLYRMGICISYDRVMEIEDWITISTCERFKEDGVVFSGKFCSLLVPWTT